VNIYRTFESVNAFVRIAEFDGDFKRAFNLAPPIMAKPDPVSGEPTKKRFGLWVMNLFKVLRALKGLRGTPFDIFGYSEERKLERRLIVEYADRMRDFLGRLSPVKMIVAEQADMIRLPRRRF
jgi:indolepyruvate ferredoxin oxidoreductase